MDGYIRRVLIDDLFEEGNSYKIDLEQGCNCLFGDNGCGKTSIINLIVNSLTLNLEGLRDIPFQQITLLYAKSEQKRAHKLISVKKTKVKTSEGIDELILHYEIHPYGISYDFNVSRVELIDRTYAPIISHFKESLSYYVKLTHVPLLRLHESEMDYDDELLNRALRKRKFSQRQISELLDPSVRTLVSLKKEFKEAYTEKTKVIKDELESLKSTIIEKVMIDSKVVLETSRSFALMSKALEKQPEEINVNNYVDKFNSANINVPIEKVKEHFGQWKALNERHRQNWDRLSKIMNDKSVSDKERSKAESEYNKSYFNLFSLTHIYNRFESIVKDVENVQKKQAKELRLFTKYEKQINKFFKNKEFSITEDGDFEIKSGARIIDIADLSSGEKHILTILGRVALSSNETSTFIADEPELSLHLDWQRKIIPSISALSPNTQVIVATHSPAIFDEGALEIDIEECRIK
ncbi:AAA family ATPase [Shewanella fidelis]|uniref:AAA family ATPase n=1 Tax=Shewanella fidelis TaxID=173509 RepID=A0AAW8NLF8_9GAMM|nr:AAA family ATPase [Shewanella fidelis]MDR8522654.1 AAA family ATPase [Shewanella fidelis]MDW4812270.1 AAA family ATPase [Shewanella fidelis]MDW4816066.1 AAA family ATPase [Shewanella fidelis]MDW4820511.1 AAA family ATPase [Shewanella fidelis]MDW4824733.1 AAA family ATPase [Shewanella fidelis]